MIYGVFVVVFVFNGDCVGVNEKFREMFMLGL